MNKAVLLILAALLIFGCTVSLDYKLPSIETPAGW